MKKQIIYLLGLMVIGLYSCNPTEDWDNMYDAHKEEQNKAYKLQYGKTVLKGSHTLTDDDYKASSNENVSKYKNFSSSLDPKTLIPEILDERYYTNNTGEEVTVNFNYYQKAKVDSANAYELTNNDYKEFGYKYPNFSSKDDAKKLIPALLDIKPKFMTKKVGTYQTVKWTLSYTTKDPMYVKVNDDFSTEILYENPGDIHYVLVKQDYKDAGQKYDNFGDLDDAATAIANIANAGGKGPGNYQFTYYKRHFDEKYNVFVKWEEGWKLASSVTSKMLLFKYTSDFKWMFVPPIKYVISTETPTVKIELKDTDYEVTGDSKYKNFYLKGMSEDEQNNVVIGKVTLILKANYNIKLNDVVEITYKAYTGSKETRTIIVKAVEDK